MKKIYKYEVYGAEYYEACEGICEEFNSLKDAMNFIDSFKNCLHRKIHRTIFKYEERNGEFYRYVKRVWLNKNGKWYSTRKVYKMLINMEP